MVPVILTVWSAARTPTETASLMSCWEALHAILALAVAIAAWCYSKSLTPTAKATFHSKIFKCKLLTFVNENLLVTFLTYFTIGASYSCSLRIFSWHGFFFKTRS